MLHGHAWCVHVCAALNLLLLSQSASCIDDAICKGPCILQLLLCGRFLGSIFNVDANSQSTRRTGNSSGSVHFASLSATIAYLTYGRRVVKAFWIALQSEKYSLLVAKWVEGMPCVHASQGAVLRTVHR